MLEVECFHASSLSEEEILGKAWTKNSYGWENKDKVGRYSEMLMTVLWKQLQVGELNLAEKEPSLRKSDLKGFSKNCFLHSLTWSSTLALSTAPPHKAQF